MQRTATKQAFKEKYLQVLACHSWELYLKFGESYKQFDNHIFAY